jgi:septum formation inhibitor MinC
MRSSDFMSIFPSAGTSADVRATSSVLTDTVAAPSASPSYSSRRLFRAIDLDEVSYAQATRPDSGEESTRYLQTPSSAYFANLPVLPVPVEGWIYLDFSTSIGSADALRRLSDALEQIALERQELGEEALAEAPSSLILGFGNLMLTPALMRKVISLVQPSALLPSPFSPALPQLSIVSVIATTPQTQLAALSAGLIVSERFPESLIQAARLGYGLKQASSFSQGQAPLPSEQSVAEEEEDLDFQQRSSGLASEPGMKRSGLNPELLNRAQGQEALDALSQDLQDEAQASLTEVSTDLSAASLQSTLLDEALPTQRITQTLRSGQRVVSEGHLVIVGDVHAGSEVVAAGDVIIWGELRGIAHAGAPVNGQPVRRTATVRALKLEALQLRIGDLLSRRPDRVHLLAQSVSDAASLIGVLPEWAGVRGDEIKLYAHQASERP